MTTEKTLELVRAYYDSWQPNAERCDEAQLRRVLDARLRFESPVNQRDQLDDFLPGLGRFNSTVRARHMLQLFANGDEAAAIYDCELSGPVDRLRCAEVFRVEGERIRSIRLVFDASAYRAKP